MKRLRLLRHLADHNCAIIRDVGPHTRILNVSNGAKSSVPRHREIKPGTARKICQQLGIPPPPEK